MSVSPHGETRKHEGRCPTCGKPLTVGVMHRVEDLADPTRGSGVLRPRPRGTMQKSRSRCPRSCPRSIGWARRVKRVAQHYESLLGLLGPELQLLNTVPLEDIEPARFVFPLSPRRCARLRKTGGDSARRLRRRIRHDSPVPGCRSCASVHLAEHRSFERRSRAESPPPAGDPARSPVDTDARSALGPRPPETTSPGPLKTAGPASHRAGLRRFPSSITLSKTSRGADSGAVSQSGLASRPPTSSSPPAPPRSGSRARPAWGHRAVDLLAGLDDGSAPGRRDRQRCPLLIVAGPGSGKTRTLTHRIAHSGRPDHAVSPARCLAITFTRRAAGEMRDRLRALLPGCSGRAGRPAYVPLPRAVRFSTEHLERGRLAARLSGRIGGRKIPIDPPGSRPFREAGTEPPRRHLAGEACSQLPPPADDLGHVKRTGARRDEPTRDARRDRVRAGLSPREMEAPQPLGRLRRSRHPGGGSP